MAEAKGIKIINYIPYEAELSIDKNHLAIIIRNLLQNATKFTDAGGKINLNYPEKEGIGYVEVKDTGVGFMATVTLPGMLLVQPPSVRVATMV